MTLKAVCKKCRIIRLCLTAVLIAMACVAGYHWGTVIESGGAADIYDYLIGGLTLILLMLAFFFAIDSVSSRVEDQALLNADELERFVKLSKVNEANSRKMELALHELAQDNARLREMLLARERRESVVSMRHRQQ